MVKRLFMLFIIILIVFSSFCFSSTRVVAEENQKGLHQDRATGSHFTFLPLVLTPSMTNGGFESGNDGSWTLFTLQGLSVDDIIVQPMDGVPVWPFEGEYIGWLGGLPQEMTQISKTITVKENSKVLSFWYWIESTDLCIPDYGYDTFSVKIDGLPIYQINLCPDINSATWQNLVLNLDAYLNTTVELLFEVTTNESSSSDEYGSNLYLDLISLQ